MKRNSPTSKALNVLFILILLITAGCSAQSGSNGANPAVTADSQSISAAQPVSAVFTPGSDSEADLAGESEEKIQTVIASYQAIQNTFKLKGVFQQRQIHNLYFILSGYEIKKLYIQADVAVKKGDLLAELDTSTLERELEGTELLRKKILVRLEELNAIEKIEGITDETAKKSVQLDLDSLELDVQDIQRKINACKLISPVDGIAGEPELKAGSIVQSYRTIIKVYGDPRLEFVVNNATIADSYDSSAKNVLKNPAGIVRGMKGSISFRTAGGTEKVACTIDRILFPLMNEGIGTADTSNRRSNRNGYGSMEKISVTALIDGPIPGNITEGLEGDIILDTGVEKKVIAVPTGSVYITFDDEHVMVLENTKMVERVIKTGIRDAGKNLIEVTEGLSEGEKVVLNPAAPTKTMK